jgi:hypothetical protein
LNLLSFEGKLIRKLPEDAKSGTITLWLDVEDDEVTTEIPISFEPTPLKSEKDDEGAIFRLLSLGYYRGTDTSVSCPEAIMAISRFQTEYDLQPTGELNDETRSKLKEVHGI